MTLGSNMTEQAQKKRAAERTAEFAATCCCCGHTLRNHIDEGNGWRCHSLGPDTHQCECYLRKGRYNDIYGYWLEKRVKEANPFKGLGKIYYLTSEIVQRWENGLNKTWLNFKLKVPYVLGFSGDYVYFIRINNPRDVSFEQVPDFYKRYVNPKKKIYEYDARLEKKERKVWRGR